MLRAAVLFSLLCVAALACPKGWRKSPEGCQLASANAMDTAELLDSTEAVDSMVTEALSSADTVDEVEPADEVEPTEPSDEAEPTEPSEEVEPTEPADEVVTEALGSDENQDVNAAEEEEHVDSSETTTMQLTADFIIEDGLHETETVPDVDDEEMDADTGADEMEVDSRSAVRKDLFEGDITLTGAQHQFLMNIDDNDNKKANAALSSRWPKGIIFYEFTPQVSNRNTITRAMKYWEANTCLRFYSYRNTQQRRRAGHNNRIRFVRKSGCFSSVGVQSSGITEVSLGAGCEMFGIAVHEIGHAIGLWHEQSRPDRDKYVRIHFENVQAGMEHNFQKYDTKTINNYNVRYDPGSIMHYAPMSFSKNGRPTIEAIDRRQQRKMGQRKGLSPADIQIVRIMYHCRARDFDDSCPPPSKCLNGGFLSSTCKCSCGFEYFGDRCEHSRRKCGGVISGRTSGVIHSPKDLSHPSMQCDWTIMAGPNDVIHLSVEDFAVGQKEQCQHSSVTIDDGNKPQTLCGSKDDVPVKFQSAVGRMGISFADESKRRKGAFQLRFNVEHAQPVGQSDPVVMEGRLTRPRGAKCGSTIHAINNGAVMSPNYPKPYDNNLDCAWLIEAPAGRHIRLMADDFEVEYSPTCEWDYVTISGAFVMNRFCGRAENFPRDILSQTNQLLIKFKTDGSKTLKGFKLSYYVV